MCVAGVMPEAVEGGGRHKLGVEILEITVSMVGTVVKAILRLLQEQTKSSVQGAVVVQGMVLMESVELAQETVVNPAVPA